MEEATTDITFGTKLPSFSDFCRANAKANRLLKEIPNQSIGVMAFETLPDGNHRFEIWLSDRGNEVRIGVPVPLSSPPEWFLKIIRAYEAVWEQWTTSRSPEGTTYTYFYYPE